MNHYGRRALDHTRIHRPGAFAQIPDPAAHFTMVGEEIQAEVTRRRDELLGPPRPGENPETLRCRSSQALQTAEELTLSDHYAFQPEYPDPDQETEDLDDPILARYYRDLAAINETINNPR